MAEESETINSNRTGFWKRFFQVLSGMAISGALLFLLAGKMDWLWGWVYLGLWLLTIVGMSLIIERYNPGHIASRAEKPKYTAKWDENLIRVYTLSSYAVLVVAALDAGCFEWSSMPLWLHLLGVCIGVLAFGLNTWAMSSNKFSKTHVAIQKDEAHHVVKEGPYAYIRHPMYTASFLMWSGIPLVLGSVWSLVPAGISVALMVVRTALEDRMLQAELSGYREYTQEVRFRLIPGVW
jgi:protein-S-isoprenylcysteine O-methyltransferase Ste14